jgi:hypothetical protein
MEYTYGLSIMTRTWLTDSQDSEEVLDFYKSGRLEILEYPTMRGGLANGSCKVDC